MALRLPDKWVWDFWLAQDGPDYHMFYLQAPRALLDERLRHWHATIGHAVSQDLVNWDILPDALAPAAENSNDWDNYTTWTGSAIQHGGTWYLFYTGTSRADNGLIQRIGLAMSDDLIRWHKYPANPAIVADPQWYEMLEPDLWYEHAWRDPWVFKYGDEFHAYITARSNNGPGSARGVIAHARSTDLLNWEVNAPVTTIDKFGHLEVPQLAEIDGRWYLLFSVGHEQYSKIYRSKSGVKLARGTHYLVGDHPLGPFKWVTDKFLFGDEIGSLYAGKIIEDPGGWKNLMAARLWAADGSFAGEISDPLPLKAKSDGQLTLA